MCFFPSLIRAISDMCSNVSLNMKTMPFVLLIGLCLVHQNTGTLVLNGTNNAATMKKRSSYSPSHAHITQNERNRRLIPYATYYISGNRETGAHDTANVEEQQQIDYTASTLKPKRPIVLNRHGQKIQYDYIGDYEQQNPISSYNYVPVAYIPGSRTSIPVIPNSQQYYPTYYQDEVATDDVKLYTTTRPKYTVTTSQPITGEKEQVSYYGDYLLQSTPAPSPQNTFIKYVVSAPTRQQKPLATRKPTYSPILFSTPQSDYLTFRYSDLYKTPTPTPTPADEASSTTPIVEITSPKNYIISHHVPVTPATQHVNVVTTTTPSYSLAYEYPEAAQFAYSVPLPPSKMPKAIPLKYNEQQLTQSSTRAPPKIEEYPLYKPSAYKAGTTLKTEDYSLYKTPTYQTDLPIQSKQYEPADADLADFSVDDIFRGFNLNKKLPDRITPENIKESIKTLSYILQMLQKADSITQFHNQPSHYSKDILEGLKDSTHQLLGNEDHKTVNSLQNVDSTYQTYDPKDDLLENTPEKDEQNTPGRAGIDYPIYSVIPETSFTCKAQRYKGFFADPDTKCQVWHYCDLNGGQASFLCPNGTIFNQAALTCDWWFNVKCAATTQLYVLNERLYKYIIPIRPSFPEDFSGPLVDQYLTEKFKETESQRKYKYPTNSSFSKPETTMSALNLTVLSEYEVPAHLLNENL